MALSPKKAGEKNDKSINDAVIKHVAEVDAVLASHWYDGRDVLAIVPPDLSKYEILLQTIIEDRILSDYVAQGWKIEKKHKPEQWVFRVKR